MNHLDNSSVWIDGGLTKYGPPSPNHSCPLMRIVRNQDEFEAVKNCLIYSRVPKEFLKLVSFFSLAVEVFKKVKHKDNIYCFGGRDSKIILPWMRSYWQFKQTDEWMFCSSGFAPYLTDNRGKNYLLLVMRGEDAGNHQGKFTLFNGYPRYPLFHEDPLAEHKGLTLTGHRKLVERLILFDKRTGRTIQPKILLEKPIKKSFDDINPPLFSEEELYECYKKAYAIGSKAVGKNLSLNPELCDSDFVKSELIELSGSCCMNFIFAQERVGKKEIYYKRIALPVFGDAFGGGTQNLDGIQGIRVFLNCQIQDIISVFGDEKEETGEPRDCLIAAVECDQNLRVYEPFRYAALWKSGKSYQSFEAIEDRNLATSLLRKETTPVVRALLKSMGTNTTSPNVFPSIY